MNTPNQDDKKVDPQHVEISKHLDSMPSENSLPTGTGLDLETITYSFDFRDKCSKERVFAAHGFTDEQMKKIVKDLATPSDSPAPRSTRLLNSNANSMEIITKECAEFHLDNKITKKDIGLFGKIVNVVKNSYRNVRHRFSHFVSDKLPRIQCTDEHFCERHQREYDVIFKKFKESQLNRSGSCCHKYNTREW